VHVHAALAVRGFLDDIWAWGWADTPRRRLMFETDIPRQPDTLPRALPPHIDAAVMTAVASLEDRFARVGITVLRHTGLRIGELLDLEIDHIGACQGCCVNGVARSWVFRRRGVARGSGWRAG